MSNQQSILSVSVSCHNFPSSHSYSPSLHQLKPLPFLLPAPQHALGVVALQEARTGEVSWGVSVICPHPDKCWPAPPHASQMCSSQRCAGMAKRQLLCSQHEQGCPLSLPAGMCLSGRTEKWVIRSRREAGRQFMCGSRLDTVTRPISNCIPCMFWCAWLLS